MIAGDAIGLELSRIRAYSLISFNENLRDAETAPWN